MDDDGLTRIVAQINDGEEPGCDVPRAWVVHIERSFHSTRMVVAADAVQAAIAGVAGEGCDLGSYELEAVVLGVVPAPDPALEGLYE